MGMSATWTAILEAMHVEQPNLAIYLGGLRPRDFLGNTLEVGAPLPLLSVPEARDALVQLDPLIRDAARLMGNVRIRLVYGDDV